MTYPTNASSSPCDPSPGTLSSVERDHIERYDRGSIALHWGMAVLVGLNWLVAEGRGLLPKGELKASVLSTHIAVGLGITALLVIRLIWRASLGHRMTHGTSLADRIGRAAHAVLYVLLGATVCTGIAHAIAHRSHLFGWTVPPDFLSPFHGVLGFLSGLHGIAADSLIILAGFHAVAGLMHHAVLEDGTLLRMLPIVGSRFRIPEEMLPATVLRLRPSRERK